jgi:large subunit ribosomal protein L23
MEHTHVILKPLITEKSTHQQNTRNTYAFRVAFAATKMQIRQAIEALYSVRVEDVRTLVRKGKPRRTRAGVAHDGNWKRAIVKLSESSKIELF